MPKENAIEEEDATGDAAERDVPRSYRVTPRAGARVGQDRMHFIRILPGDRVLVELSPMTSRGRIIYRYK